jgi:hypothetical protein
LLGDDVMRPAQAPFLFDRPTISDEAFIHIPLAELFVSTDDITASSERPPASSRASDDAITTPGRSATLRARASAASQGELFRACSTLDEALRQFVSAAIEGAGAEAVLVHQVRGDSAFIVCAHGPRRDDLLGARTPLLDPAMTAATSGACVVAEPSPGPAGRAIEARLSALGVEATGALMMPIHFTTPGRLFGVLELGRRQQFLPVEVAAIGQLAAALSERIQHAGWA